MKEQIKRKGETWKEADARNNIQSPQPDVKGNTSPSLGEEELTERSKDDSGFLGSGETKSYSSGGILQLETIISDYEKHLRDGFKELAKQLRKLDKVIINQPYIDMKKELLELRKKREYWENKYKKLKKTQTQEVGK